MMRLNIIGGTTSDAHLCSSCEHGFVRTLAHGEEQTECQHFKRRTTDKIVKCSTYLTKKAPAPIWMLESALYKWTTSYTNTVHWLTRNQMEDYDYTGQLNRLDRIVKVRNKNPKRRKARAKSG